MKIIVAFLLLTLALIQSAFAQLYTLPNEAEIYFFQTTNGKIMSLSRDKKNAYIVYRFGTKGKVKFEYPAAKTVDSWKKFQYSFWLRGGGTANDGIDLNYVYFTNNNYQYIIYDTYAAVGNKQQIGIKIINLATKNTVNIIGNSKTRKGDIIQFRENELISKGDELFD